MRVILHVTAGPALGRQIPIQSGERARFGRSDVADVCFANDLKMSEVHFELECQSDRCLVRDLTGTNATFVNTKQISEVVIEDGDEIVAGNTQLRTQVESRSDEPSTKRELETPAQVEPKLSAIELCQLTTLEEKSLQLFRPTHSPDEYVRVLAENDQSSDAIRILTLYLPKRQTIYWAYLAVDQVFPRELIKQEREALETVRTWLEKPTEPNRRAAMAIAEAMDYENAASCVAAAAGWSEGSMAPAEYADVLPDPKLTAQVSAAALMMVATEGDVTTTRDRYRKLVQIGQKLLSGEIPFPY